MRIDDFLHNLKVKVRGISNRIARRFSKKPSRKVVPITGKVELSPDIIQKYLSEAGKDDRIAQLERRIHRMDSELKKYREKSEQIVQVNITDELRKQKTTRIREVINDGVSMYKHLPKGCSLWNGADETFRGILVDIIEFKGKVYCLYLVKQKLTLKDGKRVEKKFIRMIGDRPASLLFKNYENLSIQLKNKKVSINFDVMNNFVPQTMVMS